MNFAAASWFLAGLLDGPRPGVQPARGLGLVHRRRGVADLALDRRVRASSEPAADVASYHMATLPWLDVVEALGEAGLGGAGLTVLLDQVDVELRGLH